MKRILLNQDATGGGGAAVADPPAGGGGDFVDAMVAEMNRASADAPAPATPAPSATPAPAPAVPAKPEPAKAAAAPAKTAVEPAKTPAEPAKATPSAPAKTEPAQPTLDWRTAPKQFKEAHEALKAQFTATERELKGKLFTTEQQMKALEAREYLTPEQKDRYAKLEARQQQLEAELHARDFRESPEFKDKYQKRADKIFATINNELKGIQVNDGEALRPATIADFQKVRALGDSQVEQRRTAKSLFGEDADVVLALARELRSVEEAANDEIEQKRAGFQTEREQRLKQAQAEDQQGQQFFGNYDKLLVEKFPQYFAEQEGNTEFNDALKQGLAFVDNSTKGFNGKTAPERAQAAAMMRRWAVMWPANQVLLKQNAAKIADLEATIAKLQGSDPLNGGGAGGGGGGGGAPEGSGTDSLADEIAKLGQ